MLVTPIQGHRIQTPYIQASKNTACEMNDKPFAALASIGDLYSRTVLGSYGCEIPGCVTLGCRSLTCQPV